MNKIETRETMDFTSLLDYSLQCELKILDTLYQNSGWITLSDLEFQTNYNKKTINKHLKLLSEKRSFLETGKLLIKRRRSKTLPDRIWI